MATKTLGVGGTVGFLARRTLFRIRGARCGRARALGATLRLDDTPLRPLDSLVVAFTPAIVRLA